MASNTATALIPPPEAGPAPAPAAQGPAAPVPVRPQAPGTRAPAPETFRGRASSGQAFSSQLSGEQLPSGYAPGQLSGSQLSGGQLSGGQLSGGHAAGASQAGAAHAAGGSRAGSAHAPTSAAAQGPEKTAIPAHMLPHRSPGQLLAIAREGLAEAARTRPDGLRYATAHLAALRAAAAVLAARARPAASNRRTRITSAWSLLVLVSPEFSEWASYFALGASKRAAAEAGIPRVVTPREADDLLRAAEQFVDVVESALGFTYQPPLAA